MANLQIQYGIDQSEITVNIQQLHLTTSAAFLTSHTICNTEIVYTFVYSLGRDLRIVTYLRN